jgi:microcystin-dependent protein
LTALSQVTTLDADTVGTLAATTLAPIGSISLFGGPTSPPTGWLSCDGSSLSRSTYSSLFGVLVKSIGTFTVTLATPGVFTLTAHGLTSGDGVYFTTTGSLPTGLSSNTIYFVTVVTVDTFKISTTYANYVAGTFVNTSVSQSGTHTSFRSPWGVPAGGTTNFYLPDLRLTAQGIPNATAAVGGWTTYTPSWTSSGTQPAIGNGTIVGQYRRIGQNIACRIALTTGSSTTYGTGDYLFSLPSGLTIDTSFQAVSDDFETTSSVSLLQSATTRFSGTVKARTTTTVVVQTPATTSVVVVAPVANNNTLGQTSPVTWTGSGNQFNLEFSVPIAQWTTNNNLVTYVIKY